MLLIYVFALSLGICNAAALSPFRKSGRGIEGLVAAREYFYVGGEYVNVTVGTRPEISSRSMLSDSRFLLSQGIRRTNTWSVKYTWRS